VEVPWGDLEMEGKQELLLAYSLWREYGVKGILHPNNAFNVVRTSSSPNVSISLYIELVG